MAVVGGKLVISSPAQVGTAILQRDTQRLRQLILFWPHKANSGLNLCPLGSMAFSFLHVSLLRRSVLSGATGQMLGWVGDFWDFAGQDLEPLSFGSSLEDSRQYWCEYGELWDAPGLHCTGFPQSSGSRCQ